MVNRFQSNIYIYIYIYIYIPDKTINKSDLEVAYMEVFAQHDVCTMMMMMTMTMINKRSYYGCLVKPKMKGGLER